MGSDIDRIEVVQLSSACFSAISRETPERSRGLRVFFTPVSSVSSVCGPHPDEEFYLFVTARSTGIYSADLIPKCLLGMTFVPISRSRPSQ